MAEGERDTKDWPGQRSLSALLVVPTAYLTLPVRSVVFTVKRADDPRHLERRRAVQVLFQLSFWPHKPKQKTAAAVVKKLEKVDEKIKKAAPDWPIEKIARVDLAILRLATFELTFTETPPKVVIDEAVELAKEFGSEKSPGFVNGVLATLVEKKN